MIKFVMEAKKPQSIGFKDVLYGGWFCLTVGGDVRVKISDKQCYNLQTPVINHLSPDEKVYPVDASVTFTYRM